VKDRRNYFIGVRGRLALSILLLVVLSMWLLGLALMQLTKAALTSQLRARGETIAAATEHIIEFSQGRYLYESSREAASGPEVQALLLSLTEDPDLEGITVYDSSGGPIAGVGGESGAGSPAFTFSRPLSFRPGEQGSIEIRYSRQGLRQQLGFALLRIIVQLAITALVLIVFINILLSFTVLGPIRKLLRATERIGSGDLTGAVEAGGRDEFGDLALSFNTMLRQLRGSEEQNRQQLESLSRAHKELQSKEGLLIEAEKMAAVGRVAAGVAHEVGNPLGSVTGYLAMLRDEGLSAGERGEYLARMDKELVRINRIMLDLLNYARPPRLECGDLDLNAVLRDVHHLLRSQAEFGQTAIELQLEESIPPVRGDLHRLRQMLVNLILNASQSMAEGGEVVIRSFHDPSRGTGVAVTDQGAGIPPEDLPHIFEPFFTTRKGGRGSGLGLALCQQITFSMGAAIEVDSRPGVGSTFTVLFPTEGGGKEGEGEDG
jgi:signal transduction histidine kinase